MLPLIIVILVVALIMLCLLRMWMQGPTKGSDNPKRLDGKVVVITGANTGIGKVTATDLARRGAKVLICCRDPQRSNAALLEIQKESGSQNVHFYQLDLASLKSVRSCAESIMRSESKVDYLINNAGVMMCPQWKTEDGFDMQMGTNHLGHFLFTELLLPLIKKSAESGFHPRIVIVSSMAHLSARNGISFDDINFEKKFSTMSVYGESKLANILHCKELSRRLENTGISVYSLHPGVIDTELSRHVENRMLSFVNKLVKPVASFIMKSPFHGAQTTLYCVLDDAIEGESGLYYSDCQRKTPSQQAQDMAAAKKLWDLSEELVGLKK